MDRFYSFQKLVYFCFFIFLFTNCSSDDDANVSSEPQYDAEISYELKNIAYGDGERQVADIHLPENRTTTSTKVILLIHGGAWTSGDKQDIEYMVDIAKQHYPEYALVNMNYRFPYGETTAFPMQLNDVELLVDHLNENKENYIIAEEKGIIGFSAGAHLALLYAYSRDDENQVKAVCSIVGPTDFTDENYLNSFYYDSFRQVLIGDFGYDENPEKFEEVSPVHRATASAPPTVMFYGDEDPLVPTTQGLRLRDELNSLEVYNEYYLYEGVGHGNWDYAGFLDVQTKLINFFDEFLESN